MRATVSNLNNSVVGTSSNGVNTLNISICDPPQK